MFSFIVVGNPKIIDGVGGSLLEEVRFFFNISNAAPPEKGDNSGHDAGHLATAGYHLLSCSALGHHVICVIS